MWPEGTQRITNWVLVYVRVVNYNLLTQTFFEIFQGMATLAISFPSQFTAVSFKSRINYEMGPGSMEHSEQKDC